MKKIIQALVTLLFILSGQIMADQFISLNDRNTYDYLEYLSARGDIDLRFTGSKPYSAEKVYQELAKITAPTKSTAAFIEKYRHTYFSDDHFINIKSEGSYFKADPFFSLDRINQFGKSSSQNSLTEAVSNTAFKAQVDYQNWLTLYSHTGVKLNHLKHALRDDLANQQSWQFGADNEVMSEDYTETYLRAHNYGLELALGKFPVALGNGYLHSLTLSPQKYYYENILAAWQFADFKFTTVTGFLIADDQTLIEKPDSVISNGKKVAYGLFKKRPKYLSSHRVEWQPNSDFSLAVNEAVVTGDRPIEPGYLLPILPLRWMEHYYGDQDNATMSFDFKYRPLKKIVCYGELFVDDETFTKNFTEFYGNKWAVLGGIYLTDIFAMDNLNFRMEASRVEAYVYTHKYHINRYMNLDNFLGSKYGPDSESLEFQLDYRPLSDLYLKLGYEHASVGEPLLGKEDQPDYETDVKSFLRGTVEKHRLFTFEANYQYNKFLELTGYYSHQEVINHDHTDKLYINNSLAIGFNLQVENYYAKYFKESK